MSSNYDYKKVWITENEVQEMLMNIGGAIETLTWLRDASNHRNVLSEVLDWLKRAREIGGQILSDVIGDNDE